MSLAQISWRKRCLAAVAAVAVTVLTGCEWRGLNSLSMPGTEGGGDGAFTVRAQLPDIGTIEPNSRVRVGDVNVGTITKIELQDWHALITMRLNGDVELPANARATVGQTSLLGSLHVELGPPTDVAPQGRLQDGALIPLQAGAAYPTTDQTLAALSLLLNGGGVGQMQDITAAFATAFVGREGDLRSLIEQLDLFVGRLDTQTGDIVAASDSFNNLVGQFADQKPVLDNALETIPNALEVLSENRQNLTDAVDGFGKFSALTADTVNQTKQSLVSELQALGPVFKSLANAGPDMTRALSLLATFPWPIENIEKIVRGDYLNTDVIFDLTLSRLGDGLLNGTRWEGDLTELEMQWGRTIGQLPSPYTAGNPLVAPYQFNQGP
ncbi:mammalian cell entry protein [Mycolicibacterium chitae]|uniref:Virulence factor Mce family protein n=1 Tax=Mycolicibacterium chitae TaxID=1792 RepID=A0A3S4RQ30_MYCCI|nr:MCE family protein [Mycolicibacterium chitae]MCV7108521.1 MCE family protein [Mycolicibacterium chitae]BBZ00753.1 mammalian cell entry protein [Mycolicibacterium chitae]VEG49601.1 virulence factor Mce family protein [Mycolicibacterium chitae]